jgi:hypothetical protein
VITKVLEILLLHIQAESEMIVEAVGLFLFVTYLPHLKPLVTNNFDINHRMFSWY